MRRPFALSAVMVLTACSGSRVPIETVDHVDLERFMGDWYVIASIPTFLERDAYNAVESYELNDDGTVATTFTFRQGGFDGELKTYRPTGFVTDPDSNTVWGMQFLWPFKAEYRIVYLEENYGVTVIGRTKRDYVWVMARTPSISDQRYRRATERIEALGYDAAKLERVPQRWPGHGEKG